MKKKYIVYATSQAAQLSDEGRGEGIEWMSRSGDFNPEASPE